MKNTQGFPLAWIAIYGAIIGVTGFVPLVPYVTGGGFLPLSIALAAIAPVLLGFGAGIISALVGGLIGMFINPATYPFGLLDAILVGMAPAIFCGFAFNASRKNLRIIYIIILIISGLLGEFVPYYSPGSSSGFGAPSQPQYLLLVAVFFVPWLFLYNLPISTNHLPAWVNSLSAQKRFIGLLIGTLMGLLPWSLWMIAPAALTLNWAPELAFTTWIFALWSRIILAVIGSLICVPLIRALARSGMPAPKGALWNPGKQ